MAAQTIKLTDMVRQDAKADPRDEFSAAAYLVFNQAGDVHLFHEFREADSFAEDHDDAEVYPLYAGASVADRLGWR